MAKLENNAVKVKTLRRKLRLTQAELAERCGVQRSAVTLWELGIRNPSGSALLLLKMLENTAKNELSEQK